MNDKQVRKLLVQAGTTMGTAESAARIYYSAIYRMAKADCLNPDAIKEDLENIADAMAAYAEQVRDIAGELETVSAANPA